MNEIPSPAEPGMLPLLAAAELQDHLMTVTNDLERLQRLLDDAGEALSGHFFAASAQVQHLLRLSAEAGSDGQALHTIMEHIAGAITALQFQDMVTQLVSHVSKRLGELQAVIGEIGSAGRIAGDASNGISAEQAERVRAQLANAVAMLESIHHVVENNPVKQDGFASGGVELF